MEALYHKLNGNGFSLVLRKVLFITDETLDAVKYSIYLKYSVFLMITCLVLIVLLSNQSCDYIKAGKKNKKLVKMQRSRSKYKNKIFALFCIK